MASLLRRVIEFGAQCWTATQVELQGQYSVEHLRTFAQYHSKVSPWRVLLVCLFTPLPCIVCVTLIDILPLEPLSAGATGSPKLWVRTFVSTVIMTVSTLEHFRHHIDGMQFRAIPLVMLTLVVSVITVILTIALAIGIGYPIPFGLIVGTMPWFITLTLCLACVKHRQFRSQEHFFKNTMRYMLVCGCQIAITVIYPLYNYVFVKLSPSQQTGFVLILPILKIIAKNWIYYALPDWDDGKPEAVVFNIEIFHSLYVAFCMQGSTSMRTVFVLMAVDFGQSWLSLHDVQTLLAALRPLAAKMNNARLRTASPDSRSRTALLDLVGLACRIVDAEPSLPVLLDEQRRNRLRSQKSRMGLMASVHADVGGLFPHAGLQRIPNDDAKVAPATGFVKGPTDFDTRTAAGCNHRGPEFAPSSIVPFPVPRATPTLPSDLGALTEIERGILVRVVQQLLFITEFVVLIEYVEVIMPVVYNVVLGILLELPNHQFYPFLRNLTVYDFLPTVANVMVYASLEFVSLVILTALLWWKLRFSLLHQLAFVLERRQRSVQSKLVIWVIYVMQCSIDHFGADYSFRFEWLRHKT